MSENKEPLMTNEPIEHKEDNSILDDDRYSEVFLDIEKGEVVNQNPKEDPQILQMPALTNVYDRDPNDHFVNKLALELEQIKNQQQFSSSQEEKQDEPKSTKQTGHGDSKRSSWKKKPYSTLAQHVDSSEDRYFSNSPLTMSLCSSRGNSDYEDSVDQQSIGSKRTQAFRKLTYQDVEESLNKQYTKDAQISSEIDILLTYLKGQKHLFKQSSRVTEQKFNFLMFPAIFITGTMTVVTPFMSSIGWSGWAMSVLNALLTVMITINNFMKWQAVAAIYLTISNQYDKLGISVEMTRNQYMFVDNNEEKNKLILEKMKDTEKRIMDIQNNYNDIIVPYEVQLMNPVISHINIFSFIKKIDHHKKMLIMKYKDVKNDIRFLMYKWNQEQETASVENMMNDRNPEEIQKLELLLQKKEEIKTLLIQNSSSHVYTYIDNLFIREIQHSEHYYTYRSAGMYILFHPKSLERFECGNPVVDEYLNFIFTKTSSK